MTQFDRFARKYMQLAQHRLWFIRKKNRFFIKIKSDLVARTILAQIGESGKTGKPKDLSGGGDTALPTAKGILYGIRACLDFTKIKNFNNLTIYITIKNTHKKF